MRDSRGPDSVGSVRIPRWLGSLEGENPGPTMVVVGGIHGNEPAGVHAVRRVLAEIEARKIPLSGRLIGLGGNLGALAAEVRFHDRDLNRQWFPDHLEALRVRDPALDTPEDKEQRELLLVFEQLDEAYDHPLVIMDLHSFSAEGPPFSVVADTLRNRPIAYSLRVPIIFGLEEAVEGTLLGYLADLGHIAVAFEAGQHDDPRTVENHTAAVWIALVSAGLVERSDLPGLAEHEARLEEAGEGLPRAVEIVYRHAIVPTDEFSMDPGFHNFQPVRRSQRLATDAGGEVTAPYTARMLMPLYQGQGEDGFFLIRDLGNAQLQLSAALRKFKIDDLLPYLPGVDVDDQGVHVRGLAAHPAVEGVLRLFGYRRPVALSEGEGGLSLARRRQDESRRRGRGAPRSVEPAERD